MARFEARYERQEKGKVRARGVGLTALALALALGPFAAVRLFEPFESGFALFLTGVSVLGLALAPIVLVAGAIDLLLPRTCSCPPSSMQL